MKIEELNIHGFGKLNNLTIRLSPGFNLIYGANESGKSTLQWFIRGMLFGMRGKIKGSRTEDAIPPLKRFRPFSGELYGGSLQYRLDQGEVFRIERDFENNRTKVFDFHFNPITHLFEANREQGILFAQRHLGINEACFEQTALIQQLGSRMAREGRAELYQKLVNYRLGGMEDVSFVQAEKALKEALKSYVGTEKTTVRPMDKIISRLKALNQLKDSLLEKKEKEARFELRLHELQRIVKQCEQKKEVLEQALGVCEQERLYRDWARKRKQLAENLQRLRERYVEKEELFGEILKMKDMAEQGEKPEAAEGEDIEEIRGLFYKMKSLEEESQVLENKLQKYRIEMETVESAIEPYRKLSSLEDPQWEKIECMQTEIEQIRSEVEIMSGSEASSSHKSSHGKKTVYGFGALVSGAAAFVIFLLWPPLFAVRVLAGTAVPVFLFFLWRVSLAFKGEREIKKEELSKKKLLEALHIQLKSKRNNIKEMAGKYDAGSFEELKRNKERYNDWLEQFVELNREIHLTEGMLTSRRHQITIMRNAINERLLSFGVIDMEVEDIREEHIRKLSKRIHQDEELQREYEYLQRRHQDVEDRIQELYDLASEAAGMSIREVSTLEAELRRMDHQEQEYWGHRSLHRDTIGRQLDALGIKHFTGFLEEEDLQGQTSFFKKERESTVEEINKLLLEQKEMEIYLQNGSHGPKDLQTLQEEIFELEQQKHALTEGQRAIGIALEVLTEASLELRNEYAPLLNQRMSDIMSRITSSRYPDVRADERFSLSMLDPRTRNVVPFPYLSEGTIDQAYLALRIAAAEMVAAQGERIPLLLDEVFAHYDDTRTKETLAFLVQYAERTQVLFFTCKEREAELAGEIANVGLNLIRME